MTKRKREDDEDRVLTRHRTVRTRSRGGWVAPLQGAQFLGLEGAVGIGANGEGGSAGDGGGGGGV